MANIIIRPDWYLPESRVTPERVYHNRREFLRKLGIGGAGLAAWPLRGAETDKPAAKPKYPAVRNPGYNPTWRLTRQEFAEGYNNFYEFTVDKEMVRELVGRFQISPWKIEVSGLVEKPQTLDFDDLLRSYDLEERVYRFRCVEAWSMVVPWTGFPLSKLIGKLNPKPEAKFVRFETASRPNEFPGMRRMPHYPWPYFEGLRMDEAMHPLTMVVTGLYGRPLPKQNGAPIRIVVPWKYGYKSIKSIVKIQFVDKQPTTFWETLGPDEYPFESNVDPKVPHPRWSQATERVVDTGDRIRTFPYNGYGDQVAKLYAKK